MPFPLHLINPQTFPRLTARRVTVVRFVRATAGFAASDASDPDDRGFTPAAAISNAHGAVFGISGPDGTAAAQECRIRVMRDRLDPGAQLFPEIVDSGLVTQVFPAPASALSPTPVSGREADTIVVRAARAPATATSTLLKLHFGSATGPVVGECAILVCPIISIPVKGHLVTINGSSPVSTEQTFRDLMTNANKILVPVGIKLSLEAGALADSHIGFARANTVTLQNTGHWDHELAIVMRRNPQAGVMNAYIVGHIADVAANGTVTTDNVRGVGISSAFANTNRASGTYVGAQVGFLMRDPDDLEGFGATFAHELGHVLTLEHYNNKNGSDVQDNNWSMRNLMYNFSNLGTGVPRDQVGYGNHSAAAGGGIRRGSFLGVKTLTRINQSQQSEIMRTAAQNGTFLPV